MFSSGKSVPVIRMADSLCLQCQGNGAGHQRTGSTCSHKIVSAITINSSRHLKTIGMKYQ